MQYFQKRDAYVEEHNADTDYCINFTVLEMRIATAPCFCAHSYQHLGTTSLASWAILHPLTYLIQIHLSSRIVLLSTRMYKQISFDSSDIEGKVAPQRSVTSE